MFRKLFGKPKSSATDVKPHGKTDAMSTIERLNEVSANSEKERERVLCERERALSERFRGVRCRPSN